jgi:3'-5' exoribonuclease
VLSLCRLCRLALQHYPEADRDLLITGALLHDVGKTKELSYERSFGYTDEGQLLGHILIEYEWITRKMDAIEGFPPVLKVLVQHMLVSHHGQYEFGSPKLPMFREAVMLHYLDDLDSKMAAMRSALDSELGEGNWTAYSGVLERRLLRAGRYLSGPAEAASKKTAAQASSGGGGPSDGKS